MYKPTWLFLPMCGSHDMRHPGFRWLTVVNGTPKIGASHMRPSSTVGCFSFTSTRLFSISIDLKKAGKVRELLEQFKEIGIVPMKTKPESISLS